MTRGLSEALSQGWGLSSKLGMPITCALARLLTLPPDSPIAGVVKAVTGSTKQTWISAARELAFSAHIVDIPCYSSLPEACRTPEARKDYLLSWKCRAVVPAWQEVESNWMELVQQDCSFSANEFRQLIQWTRTICFSSPLKRKCRAWFLQALLREYQHGFPLSPADWVLKLQATE